MARPLSNDIRERIVRAVTGGMSRNGAADKFETSVSAAVKLLQRYKATGSFEPAQMGGYHGHKLTPHRAAVEELLRQKPDITLVEMKAELAAQRIRASKSAISRFLIYLGNSYKKNGPRQRARSPRR